MKKTFLLAAVLCTITAAAQVEVKSIEELPGTNNQGFCSPQFAPTGDYLLFTTSSNKGLVKYDLTDNSIISLTDADNAGYEAKISDGGKMVVFRDVQYRDNRRYTAIKRINLENGEIAILDDYSREKYAFDFSGGTIRVAKGKQMKSQRLLTDIREVENKYVVAIEDMDLVLYTNNVRRVLNPQGKCSYIWPNISPDKKHLVYTVASGDKFGTYVCDMEGNNVTYLGYVGAPQWLGNNYVVGMLDLWGDGYKYTHSPLVTIRIDAQNLTIHKIPGHEIVLYPAANQEGDKVVFAADGAVYMMNVEIKD